MAVESPTHHAEEGAGTNPVRAQQAQEGLSDLQDSLARLDRRDWWLWWTALVVIFLLLGGVASVDFETVIGSHSKLLWESMRRNILGLAGVVALFGAYAVYQQLVIKRFPQQMVAQVATMVTLQQCAVELEKQAVLDPLTGLFNRRLFESRLTAEVNRSHRYGHSLTLLAFDLDEFKQVNDRYGHAGGDLVLKEFAGRLQRAVRASDVAARVGGDEFLVLLPECGTDQVVAVLTRTGKVQVQLIGDCVPVCYSAGWAQYQQDEAGELLRDRADKALYDCKRGRKSVGPVPTQDDA